MSEHRIDRFIAEVRQTLDSEDLDFYYRLVERMSREQELEQRDIAAALCFLGQKERPLEVSEPPPPKKHQRDKERKPRFEGKDFNSREQRPPREPRQRRDSDTALVNYRIDVGHNDGVKPGEIVGAIANEAGLEGRYIGRIDIRDDHALVGLPEGMPKEIAQHLKRVRVKGKALNLREDSGEGGGEGKKPFRARRPDGGRGDKKPHRKGKGQRG